MTDSLKQMSDVQLDILNKEDSMIEITKVELKKLEKEEFLALSVPEKYSYAYEFAKNCLAESLPNYNPDTIIIERQSVFDDDWYIWSVAARSNSDSETWGVWTMNLSIGGLHHGHYNLTSTGANEALKSKR